MSKTQRHLQNLKMLSRTSDYFRISFPIYTILPSEAISGRDDTLDMTNATPAASMPEAPGCCPRGLGEAA